MIEYAALRKVADVSELDRSGDYTPGKAVRFYVPLFVQAFSQCLTYPLVAAIVNHGALGADALTGFAQGQTILFMIGSLGGGLPMTGMVFARSVKGYRAFIRLNTAMMVVLTAIGILCAFPPIGPWLYGDVLNLPPELVGVARQTLLWGALMQIGFFLRNVPFVVLMNARRSFEANLATLARVIVTALTPFLFLPLGWTGPGWGLAAQTVPVWMETLLTWYFARDLVRTLPEKDPTLAPEHRHSRYYDESPSVPLRSFGQFKFTVPLSFGYFLLAASPLFIAAFVGHAADHVKMLAIHYMTIGIFNPVGFGALRLQAVQIQFPPEYPGDRRVLKFAAGVGLVLSICVLPLACPALGGWYFGHCQNLAPEYVPLACMAMLIYSVLPVVQCLRGRAEGLAAWMKRPQSVLHGQIAFALVLVSVLSLTLYLGIPGWLMAVLSLLAAIFSCYVTVTVSAHFASKRLA